MSTPSVRKMPVWRTPWFRMLGLLPLSFFAARFIEYVWIARTPSQVLWMCHLSNLMLAMGLFLGNRTLIRIAVLHQIFGFPPWFIDMFVIKIITPVSVFSHLGGLLVAVYVMIRVRMRMGTWILAIAVFVAIQLACRLITPPELNINTSHRVYEIWQGTTQNYWLFWVVSNVVIAYSLWYIESLSLWLLPPSEENAEHAETS